jgi:hypothetical protein
VTAKVGFGGIQELEAVFRSLVLFKFSGSDDADVYLGSPVMANAATGMLNSIETYWRSVGDIKRADMWRNLYRLSNAKQHENLISSYLVRHPKLGHGAAGKTRVAAGYHCSVFSG